MWGKSENMAQFLRQVAFYKWLLNYTNSNFYLYQSSVTSLPDFRYVNAIINALPATGCFAGMPARLSNDCAIEYFRGFLILCGTNTIVSRDVCKLLIDYFERDDRKYITTPQDVYTSYLLRDVPRFILPFFTFDNMIDLKSSDILSVFRHQSGSGHFHYRFKTNNNSQRFIVDAYNMGIVALDIISNLNEKINFDLMQISLQNSVATKHDYRCLPDRIAREDFFPSRSFFLSSSEFQGFPA